MYREFADTAFFAFRQMVMDGRGPTNIAPYYDLYLDNLRGYLGNYNYEYKFLGPFDAHPKYPVEWGDNTNPYVNNIDKYLLARDIEKRGTYWPVWYRLNVNGIRELSDGLHRMECLRFVNSDIKLLGIEDTYPLNNENINQDVYHFIPDDMRTTLSDDYQARHFIEIGDKILPHMYVVKLTKQRWNRVNLTQSSRCLAEMMFKSDINFPCPKIMVNEDAFKAWIGG